MGTRGAYGFRIDGMDKVTYNHYDSYPSYLGRSIFKYVKTHSIEDMKKVASKIELVDENILPTVKEIKKCAAYTNLSVSKSSTDDWYCLLHSTQGDLTVYDNEDFDLMIDSVRFLKDSLFCEWAYIINLDNEIIEVYRGFQKRTCNNRFGCKPNEDGYANVKQIGEISIQQFQDDWKEKDIETWIRNVEMNKP